MNTKKILLVMNFEIVESSASYWQESAVIYCSPEDVKSIEDSFASYFEHREFEDLDFEEIAEEVLNKSGFEWENVFGRIPECDCMITLWI